MKYFTRATKRSRPESRGAQLSNNARAFGLRIRTDVPGDGSCFFHSLVAQFGALGITQYDNLSTKEKALQVRKEAVQLIQNMVN